MTVLVVTIGVVVVSSSGDDEDVAIAGRDRDTSAPSDDTLNPADIAAPIIEGDELATFEDFADDPAIGETIPTITGTDYDGTPVVIEPGKPQIIVVMAHWCPHCQAEIPRIVDWNDEGLVPDELAIVGVSTAVDEARGNYPPPSWLDRERWPFPVIADDAPGTALRALGANSFPTMIAVGADGRVALRVSGEAEQDQFEELVEAALRGAPVLDQPIDKPTDDPTVAVACPSPDGSSAPTQTFDAPPPMCIDPTRTYTAIVTTSLGEFTIELDPAIAPETVNNFVFLSRYHYYDGIIFHRVIADFMFQGGDPDGDGSGGPGYEFDDELPSAGDYQRYSLAMANAGPDTNGSQFFIITGDDGTALPPDYSLFGQVASGTEVVDAIGVVPTDGGDRPLTDVVIDTIEIVESS